MHSRIVILYLSMLLQFETSLAQVETTKFMSNSTESLPTFETTTNQANDIVENNILQLHPVIERSSHVHRHVDPHFKGFWSKKFAWRPRWVKTWQEKKIYVAVWKKMWGPVVVKEWVPVPKPPPGWIKPDAHSYIVKKFPKGK